MEAPPPEAVGAPPSGKWSRWNDVLEKRSDKPREHTLMRRVVVPVVCTVVVALALVVVTPPFVCTGKRATLSLPRLATWSLVAGGVCAILTAQGAFVHWSKC